MPDVLRNTCSCFVKQQILRTDGVTSKSGEGLGFPLAKGKWIN